MGCLDSSEEQDVLMEDVFHVYLDRVVADLQGLGLLEEDALAVVFETASKLEEKQILPPFPEERAFADMGRWVVSAQDAGYHELALQIGARVHGE